jgi:hypothetical protein
MVVFTDFSSGFYLRSNGMTDYVCNIFVIVGITMLLFKYVQEVRKAYGTSRQRQMEHLSQETLDLISELVASEVAAVFKPLYAKLEDLERSIDRINKTFDDIEEMLENFNKELKIKLAEKNANPGNNTLENALPPFALTSIKKSS